MAVSVPILAMLAAAPAGQGKLDEFYPWIVSSVIILLGLFIYGWNDVVRVHWRRVWAISGVVRVEALRKGILWVTPLAVLGVIGVSQFQQSVDAQDTIRQITKFCLFASGLLVTVTAIILASTNLPREIDNRVIFTIVTKPTTRLEIVLGKVLGFGRISALILILMGIFTLIFLELKAQPLIADLKEQIKLLPANSPVRATDEYYINSGLLGTRSMQWSDMMQVYSRPPKNDDNRHWMMGGAGMYGLFPFELSAAEAQTLRDIATVPQINASIVLNFDLEIHSPTPEQYHDAEDLGLVAAPEITNQSYDVPIASTRPTTRPAQKSRLIPQVTVQLLDEMRQSFAGPRDVGIPATFKPKAGGGYSAQIQIPDKALPVLATAGRFLVRVIAKTPAVEFGVASDAASIVVNVPAGLMLNGAPLTIAPIKMMRATDDPSKPAQPYFGSMQGRRGSRLIPVHGNDEGPVAVFTFHNASISAGRGGKVGLMVAPYLERTGDTSESTQGLVDASVVVRNSTTGESSERIHFSPETSRTQPVEVDPKFVQGGNFDIIVRHETVGQNLGLEGGPNGAVAVVAADRSFVFNLAASLFVLWMLSVLVAIIAVFCSTFVSWPIAVVLTLVILFSHWGVNQLGDALAPGIAGRQTVGALGLQNTAPMEVVSKGVDQLSSLLLIVAKFLPDVAKFPVTDDIAHGVSIPLAKIGQAFSVIFCYGFPMLVLSYVILRSKEVAP